MIEDLLYVEYIQKNKLPLLFWGFLATNDDEIIQDNKIKSAYGCTEIIRDNQKNTNYYEKYGSILYTKFYKLDFTYAIFDILSDKTIDILENILKFSSIEYMQDFINSKTWNYYIKKYEIIELDERLGYVSRINNDYMYKDIKPTITKNNIIDKNGILYKIYINRENKEQTLLYNFLNCMFNIKNVVNNEIEKNHIKFKIDNTFHHIIKKCEKCNKFMIVDRTDTKYCNRKNENGYTCRQQNEKEINNRYKNDFIKKVEKNIRDSFNNEATKEKNKELEERFRNEHKEKKVNLSTKDYLYWLINFYKKEKTKELWREKIDKFLNENEL